MRSARLYTYTGMLLFAALSSSLYGEDWNQWRGLQFLIRAITDMNTCVHAVRVRNHVRD